MQKIIKIFIFYAFLSAFLFAQDQNDDALFRLAQINETQGDLTGAYNLYKRLYQKYPHNIIYYNAFRKNLEYTKKYDESINLISKWLSEHQTDIEQYAYLGNNYFKLTKEKEAEDAWSKAISLSPKNINSYRLVASIMLEIKLYERALNTFLLGRKECSIENAFLVEVANIYAITENHEKAINEYLKIMEFDKSQLGYVESLLMNYTQDSSFLKLAISIVKNKIISKNDDITYYYLLAWLFGEEKNYSDALYVYIQIEKLRKTNGYELLSFAERAFRDKAYEVSANAYKKAIEDFKVNTPQSKFGYAQAIECLNDWKNLPKSSLSFNLPEAPVSESIPLYSGVISQYEEIVNLFPKTNWASEALFRIGTIKLEKFFDLDGALDAFTKIEKNTPFSEIHLNSLLKAGDILVMKNKMTEAFAFFEKAKNYPIQNSALKDVARFKIAELNYFLGNFGDSKKALIEITKNYSTDIANDAILLLNFIKGNVGTEDSVLTFYSKGELLERQRKNSEALSVFEIILKSFPVSNLIDETYLKIAILKLSLKNIDGAIKDLNEIIKRFPESTVVDKTLFILAEIYQFELKNNTLAIEYYDRILREFPNSFYTNRSRERIRELRGEKNL